MPTLHHYFAGRIARIGMSATMMVFLTFCLAGRAVSDLQMVPEDNHNWLPTTPPSWPLVVQQHKSPLQVLTRGVTTYNETLKTVGGPEHASVLNVDLGSKNVRLGVVQAHEQLLSSDETLSSMANRSHAVAGINGDFFEINGTGDPINMVMRNGQLLQSPGNYAVLGVTRDGQITMAHEAFSGTVTAGGATRVLNSVNRYTGARDNGLTLITPALGDMPLTNNTVVLLQSGMPGTNTYTVRTVQTKLATLKKLPSGTQALVGGGTAGAWLRSTLHKGDTLSISQQIVPDNNLVQAIGGGPILIKNGQFYNDPIAPNPGDTNVHNPLTAVGLAQDGRHAIFVVFDGHEAGITRGRGLTRPQMAGYLLAHGAYQAMMFDGGGSSEMVGRLPGQKKVSVLNTPSDGRERPVANGLFVYSTEERLSRATSVVINNNKPITLLTNTSIAVKAYARDAMSNTVDRAVQLTVHPSTLARIRQGRLIAGNRTGHGLLVGRADKALSSLPITVVDHVDSLHITPLDPDLDHGQKQQFQVSATVHGTDIAVPADAVHWSVTPDSLGSITQNGLFTASETAVTLGQVTATLGGTSASVSVAVGKEPEAITPLTDLSNWGVTDRYLNISPRPYGLVPAQHIASDGSIFLSTSEKQAPGDVGSLDLHYDFASAQKVYNISAYPAAPENVLIGSKNGRYPSALGLWVKGNATLGALNATNVTLKVGFYQSDNTATNIYPTVAIGNYWRYVTIPLQSTYSFPLRLNYLALVADNPESELKGDIYFSKLAALYPPRPLAVTPYQPFPHNPDWLQFKQSPTQFSQDGTTIAAFDDAHTTAAAPDATGEVVLKAIGKQLQRWPNQARPALVQSLGDMVENGQLPNLQHVKSIMDGFGMPYHIAVGNHEITQGATPEDQNFTAVFGPTHYAYTVGNSRFIVLDSSHIGLLCSDAYQVPSEPQYEWLKQQLDANTAQTVFITTHVPAYDPHSAKNSQFRDGFEAAMYEELAHRYEQTHEGKHVVLLFGHARGFSEQRLDTNGIAVKNGIPNFVVADVGAPAYAPANQGGFSHYALFHIRPNGVVQFAVLPVLSKIEVTASRSRLKVGQTVQVKATGTTVTGGDLPAIKMPIQNPASHLWSSSDTHVASIDTVTGLVKARHPGTVTVTSTSGQTQGSMTLMVTR
ncbi:hypothetical protein KDH_35060 [Dictyobacter sp. S3.2.2.5]|uniref:BIG2 domain-containing protein n=1 Tax=Dictyobacter halimunensis TaxID=3026934 RepID=A0ABQ6FW51_9CHLR|nr:hypothetical protein KDH_35060 [Dictyobacter sp. S3.2.2.5]